jgi:glycosyltransferase involved in cell wall biosynthesis
MSRKIVFINQATGYLTIDVVNRFAKDFDEVALITGSIRVQNTSIDPKVKVFKIVRYNRGSNFRKALSWLVGTVQILWLLKTSFRNYEAFFYTIPPTAYLLSGALRKPFSLAIFDLYPEALKANGFNESGLLYRWWAGKNRQVFPCAHKIYTLSESMKMQVLSYAPGSAVHTIPNWSAFSDYRPITKNQNSLIRKEGLQGKFIIQYSGNIGVTHNVETLIEIADKLRLRSEIEFQIIGRGDRSHVIGEMITKRGLTNCHLLPFRRDEDLYESLCASDISVITLDDKTNDISVPSKTYNIMAAGIPIMAIAPTTSGVSQIIHYHQAGRAFEKNQIDSMCSFILELQDDKQLWQSLSSNSLQAAANYTDMNADKYFDYYINTNTTSI